jgi:putative addiction module killer protein
VIEVRQTVEYSEWFANLRDRVGKARIDIRVRRLALGNPGDVKPVGEGVSELRIDYGPGYRVYFIQQASILIVLLAGGDKSTQDKDIEAAKKRAQALKESPDGQDDDDSLGPRSTP